MFIQWCNGIIKKMSCFDYAILKIAVFAFALLVAKLWPTILGLDWWWYAGIYVAAAIYFILKFFIFK